MTPFTSVIIPHYMDLIALDTCIRALERQTISRSAFEIVVCDNASPVGEEAVAAVIDGRARLVICHDRGAGPTRNAGVAAATGTLLAFIDSDCVPVPHWLEAGIDALADTDIVGGHVSVSTRPGQAMTGSEAYESVFAFNMASYIKHKGFAGSGNLFVPKSIFEHVGGFRGVVSEDVDWSHRARALGYRITYARRAEVYHPARVEWSDLTKKMGRVHSEMFELARGRPWGRVYWLLRTWAMPLSAVAHTPRVIRSKALPDTITRAKALFTLYKLRLWRFKDGHRPLFNTWRP